MHIPSLNPPISSQKVTSITRTADAKALIGLISQPCSQVRDEFNKLVRSLIR
jgi:hypothetical protein